VTVVSTTYRDELTARVRDLWQAVTELTVIAFEDRPRHVDLIAVDDLCDRVSDLQGLVHELRQACSAEGDPAEQLDRAGHLLHKITTSYWRELRAGRPLEDLTVASRRRSDELNAWSHSLAVAVAQCEEPLHLATTAWRLSWPELLRIKRTESISLIDPQVQHDPNSTVEVPR
jgi:hypothetical protein